MSYRISEYPQDKYRFRIYDNVKRLTWKQIQAEQGADCVGVVNLALFALTNIPGKAKAYDHQSAIMIGGSWGLKPKYHEYGFLIDESGRLTIGTEDQAVYDYAIGCPPVDINGRRYTDKDGGRNGWTYTGIKPDGTVVVLLCSKDTPETTDSLEEALRARGCVHILRWDGSWSSQGTLGPGLEVTPSQRRICRSWLLIYKRKDGAEPPDKEDTMSNQYTVTPSIGVNIRSGPGMSYGKTGAYTKGTVVTILEKQDNWGRTDKGWVSFNYLKPVKAPQRTTDNGIAIQSDYIPQGRKNRPGGANPCRYLTIHETGNAARGADTAAHASYLKGDSAANALVSWHYTVDDHAIVQHLPDTETAYHAGDGANGPGNAQSIGIEICVNADGDFAKAQANAASLVRLLMKEHQIQAANIKQHHDWSGKDCPQTIRHTTGAWDKFLDLCNGKSTAPPALVADVDVLAGAGIVGAPDYWKAGSGYSDGNVACLIHAMADYIRKEGN